MNRVVKLGAIVALLSLLIMPLGGCAGESFNGLQVLSTSQIPVSIKFFLVLSMAGAAFSCWTKVVRHSLIAGIGAAIALCISYYSGGEVMRVVSMKFGFYTAFLGFALIIVGSLPREMLEKATAYLKR